VDDKEVRCHNAMAMARAAMKEESESSTRTSVRLPSLSRVVCLWVRSSASSMFSSILYLYSTSSSASNK
jgi:hypothetical protein